MCVGGGVCERELVLRSLKKLMRRKNRECICIHELIVRGCINDINGEIMLNGKEEKDTIVTSIPSSSGIIVRKEYYLSTTLALIVGQNKIRRKIQIFRVKLCTI